ncbi:MAG: hypothetical protein FK730_14860 [Asgard group archaeon]|nr:hypothetical protein [Asgard group archaeon]
MSFSFSVKICDTNPQRWYVSYKFQESPSLTTVKMILQKEEYVLLADTPTIIVFQHKKMKLTWNKHGLIQIDLNDNKIHNQDTIENLVEKLFSKFI